MRPPRGAGRRGVGRVALVTTVLLAATACSTLQDLDSPTHTPSTAPTTTLPAPPKPTDAHARCGRFTIAYAPSNGYELSAFIVGQLAKQELGCRVTMRPMTPRDAWRAVAKGTADVYLDAYGTPKLVHRMVAVRRDVTVVGPNGIHGAVSLMAPYFLSKEQIESARDLGEDQQSDSGGEVPTPTGPRVTELTTAPQLRPLARSVVDNLGLPLTVAVDQHGMRALLGQATKDNDVHHPGLYLVAAPRGLTGDGPGRYAVDLPVSGGRDCVPGPQTTLCSLADFEYLKIANAAFARAGGPAYQLVYRYRLSKTDLPNVMQIIELSGYDVGPADADAWLNTHEQVWSRWLRP